MKTTTREEFILALVLLTLMGFRPADGEKPGLLELIPENVEKGRWQKHLDAELYKGGDLYLYINGGAEIYHEYGFKQVVLQDYVNPHGKSISLEIFEMESSDSAFGIYTFKTSPSGRTVDIGNSGRLEGYYMNFWKGPFLITLTGFEEDEETIDGLLALARAVEEKIPLSGETREPPLLHLLPREKLVEGSLKYYKGHLGLFNNYHFTTSDVFRFMEGGSGEYENGVRIFILAYATREDCLIGFEGSKKALEQNPRYRDFSASENSFDMKDEQGLSIFITNRGNYVLIIMGWESLDDAEKIAAGIGLICKKIVQYGIKREAGVGEVVAPSSLQKSGRKVRTPQGRMVVNSDSGQLEESATENKPPCRTGPAVLRSKGETAR